MHLSRLALSLCFLSTLACGPSASGPPGAVVPPTPPPAPTPPAVGTPTPPVAPTPPVPPTPPAAAASASGPVAPPLLAAQPPSVLQLTQGQVPDIEKNLAAADQKVRDCVGKAKAPPKKGELAVKITIATSGSALNVATTPSGDVGKDVAACAKAALRDHSFGKPTGGGVAAVTGTYSFP